MARVSPAIVAAVVAVATVVTLGIFERRTEAIPNDDIELSVDGELLSIPRGGLTVTVDEERGASTVAVLTVSLSDPTAIPELPEMYLADEDGEYALVRGTSEGGGTTLNARVPADFDPSSAVLRLALDDGPTMSISLETGRVVDIVDRPER